MKNALILQINTKITDTNTLYELTKYYESVLDCKVVIVGSDVKSIIVIDSLGKSMQVELDNKNSSGLYWPPGVRSLNPDNDMAGYTKIDSNSPLGQFTIFDFLNK